MSTMTNEYSCKRSRSSTAHAGIFKSRHQRQGKRIANLDKSAALFLTGASTACGFSDRSQTGEFGIPASGEVCDKSFSSPSSGQDAPSSFIEIGKTVDQIQQGTESEVTQIKNNGKMLASGTFGLVKRVNGFTIGGQDLNVAVKIFDKFQKDKLNCKQLESQEVVAISEAKCLEILKHNNIIGFHKFFEHKMANEQDEAAKFYIVMDLCEGGSLQENMITLKSWTSMERHMGQMIDAVAHMHSKGIMHRDIKPDNVAFQNGQIKLIDFGLACRFKGEEDGVTKCIFNDAGTKNFKAPEIASVSMYHSTYDAKVDVWSLGKTLQRVIDGIKKKTLGTNRNQKPGTWVTPPIANLLIESMQAQKPELRPASHELKPFWNYLKGIFGDGEQIIKNPRQIDVQVLLVYWRARQLLLKLARQLGVETVDFDQVQGFGSLDFTQQQNVNAIHTNVQTMVKDELLKHRKLKIAERQKSEDAPSGSRSSLERISNKQLSPEQPVDQLSEKLQEQASVLHGSHRKSESQSSHGVIDKVDQDIVGIVSQLSSQPEEQDSLQQSQNVNTLEISERQKSEDEPSGSTYSFGRISINQQSPELLVNNCSEKKQQQASVLHSSQQKIASQSSHGVRDKNDKDTVASTVVAKQESKVSPGRWHNVKKYFSNCWSGMKKFAHAGAALTNPANFGNAFAAYFNH